MQGFRWIIILAAIPVSYVGLLFAELKLEIGGQTLFDLLTQRRRIESRFDGFRMNGALEDVVVFGSCDFQEIFDESLWRDAGIPANQSITDGQTPLNSYFLLRSRVRSGLIPKLVVYFLDSADFGISGAFNFYLFAQNLAPSRLLLEQAGAFGDLRMLNVLAARQLQESGLVPRDAGTKDTKGDLNAGTMPMPMPKVDEAEARRNVRTQTEFLRKFIKFAQEMNIRILFIAKSPPSNVTVSPAAVLNGFRPDYSFDLLEIEAPLQGADINDLNQRAIEKAKDLIGRKL